MVASKPISKYIEYMFVVFSREKLKFEDIKTLRYCYKLIVIMGWGITTHNGLCLPKISILLIVYGLGTLLRYNGTKWRRDAKECTLNRNIVLIPVYKNRDYSKVRSALDLRIASDC